VYSVTGVSNVFICTSLNFYRKCIRNGVPDTDSETVGRLNPLANPLAYMLDGKDSTKWISRPELYMPGGLQLVVDLLNGEYEVSRCYCVSDKVSDSAA